jgi:uncharacterized membrane protein
MGGMLRKNIRGVRLAGAVILVLLMIAAMHMTFPGLGPEGERVLRRMLLVATLECVAFLAIGDWIGRQAEAVLRQLDRWFMADQRRPLLLLCALILAYIIAWDGITFLRHYFFHTTADLAMWDQVVWNTAHGRPFAASIEVANFLGDHLALYVAVLSLFYRLVPSPYTLLGAQSCLLGLCAWPLYRLARRRLQSPAAAIAIAACALLYPPLGFINRFDFHPEVFALPMLVAAWERLDADDLRGAGLWMGLALLAKEDIGLTVAALGVYGAVVHKRYRFGVVWAGVGLAYSLLALFVVIPAFRGGPSDTLARYDWLGTTPAAILTTLVSRPGPVVQHILTTSHLLTLLQLLAPLALLPLAGLPALLVALPAIAYNLASTWASQGSIYFQYMLPIIPALYVAAVVAIQRLATVGPDRLLPSTTPRRTMGLLLVVLLLSTLGSWAYENPITGHTVIESGATSPEASVGAAPQRSSLIPPNQAALQEGLRQVPAAAYVITTEHYAPHLTHRLKIQVLLPSDKPTVPAAAQDIFLNLTSSRDMLGCATYREYLQLAAQADFGTIFYRDGVLLAERDSGDRQQLQQLVANWPGCD